MLFIRPTRTLKRNEYSKILLQKVEKSVEEDYVTNIEIIAGKKDNKVSLHFKCFNMLKLIQQIDY